MFTKKGLAAKIASAALALTVALGGVVPAVALVAATPKQAFAASMSVKASSLKVNKKTVKKNKKLTFTVTITGNPDYVWMNLRPKKLTSSQWIAVDLKKVSGNTYKGSVKVTKAWKKGQWIVESIFCGDNETGADLMVYNKATGVPKTEKQANFKGGNFTVKGTKGDSKAPKVTVKGMKYGAVNEYGERKVTIKATDNRAGVSYVDLYYVGPDGKEYYAYLDKKSGKKMTGTVYDLEGAPKGKYQLKRIVTMDKVGNSLTLLDSRYKKEKKNFYGAKVKSLKAGDFTL